MSVTTHILRLLVDGGKGMDDAILVAEAMQRGDDARKVFDLVKSMEAQERSREDMATILLIYADALIREQERTTRTGRYASAYRPAPSGPKERWGYDGPITPRLADRDWWPLRNSILDRDAHECRYCGDLARCADHVIPLSRGGTNDEDNLVACCLPCNSSKSDRLLSEWAGRYTA